jgi:hypothetical protein
MSIDKGETPFKHWVFPFKHRFSLSNTGFSLSNPFQTPFKPSYMFDFSEGFERVSPVFEMGFPLS